MLVTRPEATAFPIHFEDRSGTEFERLCFAYILRMEDWDTIDWYGQLGGDNGRDIWATCAGHRAQPEAYCFQCANRRRLEFQKASSDIDKVLRGPNGIPNRFIIIVGGKVSASMRDRIRQYAQSRGIATTEIWSGTEFEERLRVNAPSLLLRFCQGEAFPETAQEIKAFAGKVAATSDHDILQLMAQCFDRPAFTTPFSDESSVPDFKKAITDTIEALNTGIHRLRDGTLIQRIPSRHDIQDEQIRQVVDSVVADLMKLRATYDQLLSTGDIKPCGCGRPDCPVFFSSPQACRIIDELRYQILERFRIIYPEFWPRIW